MNNQIEKEEEDQRDRATRESDIRIEEWEADQRAIAEAYDL